MREFTPSGDCALCGFGSFGAADKFCCRLQRHRRRFSEQLAIRRGEPAELRESVLPGDRLDPHRTIGAPQRDPAQGSASAPHSGLAPALLALDPSTSSLPTRPPKVIALADVRSGSGSTKLTLS